jgi:hypothetical protein
MAIGGAVAAVGSAAADAYTLGANVPATAAEIGAGGAIGGAIGYGIGAALDRATGSSPVVSPNPATVVPAQDEPKGPEAKPKGCPPRTKPIDSSGLTRDDIHIIKDGLDAKPPDWVGIAPNSDVITGDGDGNAVNNECYEVFLNRGKRDSGKGERDRRKGKRG